MNDKKKAEYIPFNAINEFMRNDFRLNVIRTSLISLPQLDQKYAKEIDRMTKKFVKVAGFRNSIKAPVSLKSVAMVSAFKTHSEVARTILQVWSESKLELRSLIYNILIKRSWKILPIDIDRTKLPGFLTQWPVEDDYEILYDASVEIDPDLDMSIDETSLMAIWLSGRLPINKIPRKDIFSKVNVDITLPENN